MAEALEKGKTLVAEAGTGTGKTFAYLVPALLKDQKVLISTAGKTLQDQLSYYAVGETVELTVQVPASGGEYEEQTVSVTLGANPN